MVTLYFDNILMCVDNLFLCVLQIDVNLQKGVLTVSNT